MLCHYFSMLLFYLTCNRRVSYNNDRHLVRNITSCCSVTNVNDTLKVSYNTFFIYVYYFVVFLCPSWVSLPVPLYYQDLSNNSTSSFVHDLQIISKVCPLRVLELNIRYTIFPMEGETMGLN